MRRLLLRVAIGVGVLVVLAACAIWACLRGSLPQLDGSFPAPQLSAPVTLERDAMGVPTISGSRRADLAFALGVAHGQDRLFQMDLLRRASAGELAALLGPAVVPVDREFRIHRFRAVARKALAALPDEQRAELEAYAAGVNAGAAAATIRPFEYLLLGERPAPWQPEDSLLCIYTMFLDLQGSGAHEKQQRALIAAALPPVAARFVYAEATDWEAPADGSHADPPVLPTAAEYDLAAAAPPESAEPVRRARSRDVPGSNNWAIAGRRTTSGAALVANDMHLGIRVPNIWYRARLRLAAGAAPAVDVTGVTLPGVPGIVVGSNGHIAWGYTNSYGEFQRLIVAEPDPAAADHYLTPAGSRPFEHHAEEIGVRGSASVPLDVMTTEWGPVIGRDGQGRPVVLEWTAYDPTAVNLALVDLERAQSVDEALPIAARAGIPAENFVVGDSAGHIGWTIAGRLPLHDGAEHDGPRLSTDPTAGFAGWLPVEDYPRIVDPPAGQIVTANARVVGGEALQRVGDGGYDRGVRQGRAAADLAARGDRLRESDMLAVQLDDTAVLIQRWQGLLLGILDDAAVRGHPRRAELRAVVQSFSGHAAVNDAAYRLIRAFRMDIEQRVFSALIAPARAASPAFRFTPPNSFEGPLWMLLKEQPGHLLPRGNASWRDFELLVVDGMLGELEAPCPVLAACTWGKVNTMRVRHPLSGAVPLLGLLTDMPSEQLPGDEDMPRVVGPAFGASERYAVAPGHESEGYFHMPGGQSGHPLSPYYRLGYEYWAHGRPMPFLPGAAEHTLTLGH